MMRNFPTIFLIDAKKCTDNQFKKLHPPIIYFLFPSIGVLLLPNKQAFQ